MRLFLIVAQADEFNIPRTELGQGSISTIMQIVWAVTGGVALLIITIAGLQYVLSRGDPAATAKAKNAIIYALVGLLVSVVAFGIVRFVVGEI